MELGGSLLKNCYLSSQPTFDSNGFLLIFFLATAKLLRLCGKYIGIVHRLFNLASNQETIMGHKNMDEFNLKLKLTSDNTLLKPWHISEQRTDLTHILIRFISGQSEE